MADEKEFLSEQKERFEAFKSQTLGGYAQPIGESDKKADERIEKAEGASLKPVIASEREIGEDAESPDGPVGLDIGTSHIVAAQEKFKHIHVVKQLNAFFTVPKSKFSRSILNKNQVMYYERGDLFYVIGYSAESFANMFNMNSRQPVKEGFLSSHEEEGMSVIKAIVGTLIKKPRNFGETLCFAIPGEPIDGGGSVVYHESVIKRFLGSMGYSPVSINEGMAIVVSELASDDYTGIGISMGGGMCNVCLSYLSFPVITYSIKKAGDYIDSMVEASVGVPATKIKVIKEEGLDLSKEPTDRITTALHIFYDELIFSLLDSLQRVLTSTDKVPKISSPIPIVLSGGTAMPKGCKEKFEKVLNSIQLPIEISGVRLAEDPLNTTAKGALIMAMTEAKS
ncbi:MAG TPA: hypothetical protein VMW78_02030 [Anaerolineae bacterium]|nr:hypothetical protein [Anaerolineae bacterium]